MSCDKSCLIVFARAPIPGRVKTRLLAPAEKQPARRDEAFPPSLSPVAAARLYSAFVADILDKGVAAGFARRRLYVDGALDDATLSELGGARGYALRPQSTGDLGERLQAAVDAEFTDGATQVVVIGSDSPTLPVEYLSAARNQLASQVPPVEVVLGPATDGGYYLVGLRTPRKELFAPGIPWSTSGVLPTTLLRISVLGKAGIRSTLLPFFYDCDTPDDLRLLVAHLRQAASQIGIAEGVGNGPSDRLGEIAAPHTQRALSELSLYEDQN